MTIAWSWVQKLNSPATWARRREYHGAQSLPWGCRAREAVWCGCNVVFVVDAFCFGNDTALVIYLTALPPCSVPKWKKANGSKRLSWLNDFMEQQLQLVRWHFSFWYWTRGGGSKKYHPVCDAARVMFFRCLIFIKNRKSERHFPLTLC